MVRFGALLATQVKVLGVFLGCVLLNIEQELKREEVRLLFHQNCRLFGISDLLEFPSAFRCAGILRMASICDNRVLKALSFLSILWIVCGAHDAAATENREKEASMPNRNRAKWEYAQWITEDSGGLRNETFDTEESHAFGVYVGDSNSPARGKFLSQLLGRPETEGSATDTEILNAIGAIGWELVKVEHAKDKEIESSTVTRTFKRPKSDANGDRDLGSVPE